MTTTSPGLEDTISVDQASRLLDVTRQRIQQDDSVTKAPNARGRVLREPVVRRHLEKLRDHEQAIERMMTAGSQIGILYPRSDSTSGGLMDGALIRRLIEQLEQLPDAASARTRQALAEVEIDRLKSEIRRANNVITGLVQLIASARPAEDVGLDLLNINSGGADDRGGA